MAFMKAYGLLFTGKDIDKFEPTVNEFLRLLDTQLSRATRKFMEQGYHITIANNVSMLGFSLKENVLMRAISPRNSGFDIPMEEDSS